MRVVAIGLVVGAIAAVIAIAIPWLPDQASEEAEWIDLVFWFTTAIVRIRPRPPSSRSVGPSFAESNSCQLDGTRGSGPGRNYSLGVERSDSPRYGGAERRRRLTSKDR